MWNKKCDISSVILEVYASDLARRGAACACENILNYTNTPENIMTLLLLILLTLSDPSHISYFAFWSIKTGYKYVKSALKYQIIKRGEFFSTPFIC